MKITFLLAISATLLLWGCGEETATVETPVADTAPAVVEVAAQTAEVGCATCIYKMEGVSGCQLAAKIDGVARLVEGSDVDAHAEGLCSAAKQAKLAGKIEADMLVASELTLQ